MFPIAMHTLAPGAGIGEITWPEGLLAAGGAVAIVLLVRQLWWAQRVYALELAEQARLVAEEQERTSQSYAEREVIIKESQAKSEMLATLSRETRAHLNGIIGSADLMLDQSLGPDQREHLARLRASAESLHRSLNDVLDYSSIETGQIQIAQAPFELRQPLIEVVETLSPIAQLKGLDMVLIIAPDAPAVVSGDAARMRQILLNLMANAVKFTASGRIVLRVELPQGSAAASRQGGTWVHFSVSDTGVGIPEELRATIFERLGDSDTTSARKFGGSGLELAISKRLVELMGGQIGARSLPEGGLEFWVVLPLGVEQSPAPPGPGAFDGLHVAVLDELAASRVATTAMLSRMGVDHDATDTLAKAAVSLREAAQAGSRELALVVDESIVKAAGDSFARALAADPALKSARIVVLSRNPEGREETGYGFTPAAVLRRPLLRSEVLGPALRAPQESGTLSPSIRAPRVLVVDDDEISRTVSSQLLKRLGCAVELAASGADAVARARKEQFDLIFMDCQMPEMDGFETTGRIRAATQGTTPPIVALTANISDQDRKKCFDAGMCDFVGKPVRKADLMRALKRWAQPVPA